MAKPADLIAEAIALRGHEVRVAYDGAEALRLVRDFTPQVAILDIGLPGMDGYELAGACARSSSTPASRNTW